MSREYSGEHFNELHFTALHINWGEKDTFPLVTCQMCVITFSVICILRLYRPYHVLYFNKNTFLESIFYGIGSSLCYFKFPVQLLKSVHIFYHTNTFCLIPPS